MTLKEIQNMSAEELNKLTYPEAKAALRKAATAQYNRFKRLEESGSAEDSQLYNSVSNRLGADKVTDEFYKKYGEGGAQNLNQARKRLAAVNDMLNKESSSITGTKRQLKRLYEAPERLNQRTQKKEKRVKAEIPFEAWRSHRINVGGKRRTIAGAFWDAFAAMREDPGIFALYDSGEVQDFIMTALNLGEDITDWAGLIVAMLDYEGDYKAYEASILSEREEREKEFSELY